MASTATLASNPLTGQAFGPPNSLYIEYEIDVVCDAEHSDPNTVDLPTNNNPAAGVIGAVEVVLPDEDFPDAFNVVITKSNGVPIFTGGVAIGTAGLKKRLFMTDGENDGRSDFVGKLTVTISGNNTASATWKVFVLVF